MTYKSAVLAALVILGLTASAHAGVYTDDLSKCLVKSTTDDEKRDLVLWVFAAISAHPAAQPYSSMTPEQRVDINKHAGALVTRLVTDACRAETVAALKYEGANAMNASFEVLGQVAMRSLMTDHDVGQAMGGVATFIDMEKWNKLVSEAGIATTDGAKPAQ